MASERAGTRLALARLVPALVLAAIPGCGLQQASPAQGAPATDGGQSALPPGARAFLATLDDRKRDDVLFRFDDRERTRWHYVPQRRDGLPLQRMDARQRMAAFDLVGTGLSERGAHLARGVVELEGILDALEGGGWWFRRDPGLYYLSLFVGPDPHPWAWRFEGHHLSVNVTGLGPHGQVVAPLFVGANPARVPNGPNQGARLLASEEDLAFELLGMLDGVQRERATIADQTPGDIVSGTDPVAPPMAFAGLPAAAMTGAQQQQLRRLLELYAGRMADAAARSQMQRIDEAGFERLHFAWAGAYQPGRPHYYRIHGPTVLVEYDNSQDGANHIHTVWRDLQNDFGGDLLRRHHGGRQPHRH